MRGSLTRDELRRAVKVGIAASAAWALGVAAGEPVPVFAAIVPIVAIKQDPFSAAGVSADRILGVFIGVALGIVALEIQADPGIALAVGVIAAGIALGTVLRIRGEVNFQITVSALIMLFVGGRAETVALARIWETAIGAAVALIVAALLWPPDPVGQIREEEARLRAEKRKNDRNSRELSGSNLAILPVGDALCLLQTCGELARLVAIATDGAPIELPLLLAIADLRTLLPHVPGLVWPRAWPPRITSLG